MLGPAAHLSPIESGHRPKSIACMQRSGSNSSLKNSVLHSVNDPRYHSIAALPPRMEIPADLLFNPMMEERPPRPIRGGLQRGPTQPDEQPDFPSEDLTVLPSDPDYRKVAQNLMTCSPQPRSAEDCRHPPLDLYADSKKSPDELAEDISSVSRAVPPTSSSGVHTFVKGQDIRQIHSPSELMISCTYCAIIKFLLALVCALYNRKLHSPCCWYLLLPSTVINDILLITTQLFLVVHVSFASPTRSVLLKLVDCNEFAHV